MQFALTIIVFTLGQWVMKLKFSGWENHQWKSLWLAIEGWKWTLTVISLEKWTSKKLTEVQYEATNKLCSKLGKKQKFLLLTFIHSCPHMEIQILWRNKYRKIVFSKYKYFEQTKTITSSKKSNFGNNCNLKQTN